MADITSDLAASAYAAWQSDPVDGAVIVQPGNGVNLYGLGGTPADITVAACNDVRASAHRKLMAKLKASTRKKIPSSKFGLPGSRKYPMPDRSHAANAKARATQMVKRGKLSPASAAKIRSKANAVLGE